jgi:hypothetical protein
MRVRWRCKEKEAKLKIATRIDPNRDRDGAGRIDEDEIVKKEGIERRKLTHSISQLSLSHPTISPELLCLQ